MARRSITKDHTPLFGKTLSPSSSPKEIDYPDLRANDQTSPRPQSLADALDEVLQSPSGSALPPSPVHLSLTASKASLSPMSNSFASAKHKRRTEFASTAFGNRAAEELDEMEWVPTTSPYGAFNSKSPPERAEMPCKASPTNTNKGPFWFKVPPRPIDPASRLRQLPKAPLGDAQQPHDYRERPFEQRPPGPPQGMKIFGSSASREENHPEKEDTSFSINEPRFFAPERANDPRNELSGLFGRGFSLSGDEEGKTTDDECKDAKERKTTKGTGLWGLVLLVAALGIWIGLVGAMGDGLVPPAWRGEGVRDAVVLGALAAGALVVVADLVELKGCGSSVSGRKQRRKGGRLDALVRYSGRVMIVGEAFGLAGCVLGVTGKLELFGMSGIRWRDGMVALAVGMIFARRVGAMMIG